MKLVNERVNSKEPYCLFASAEGQLMVDSSLSPRPRLLSLRLSIASQIP
jgi:hypothetical protein